MQNCMKSPVEYYIKPWPVRFHQCWTRCPLMSKGPWKPKGLVVCALKCWLAYKAMQNSCDLAGFASADWCWDWISGGAVLLSIHPSIPFPCYYFFLALSLIILFFFLSLVSSLLSFCLHVWFFLSVPLILCSSFSPFYSSSFVFHWWVHLLQVDFFIIYVPLAVDEFALSSSLATQTFPSGLLPGAEFL